MEFKKINEDKFQCLLYEEDLEYNNITLDDFFRNDTEKIHNLLEVIMDFDITDVMKANTIQAKTDRNISVDGVDGVSNITINNDKSELSN